MSGARAVPVIVLFCAVLCLSWHSSAQPAQQLPFPVLPSQYSTLVSMSFLEGGFTLQFREYVDSLSNLYRAEGKASTPDTVMVYDGTTATTWSSTTPCSIFKPNTTFSNRFQPAYNYFMNFVNTTDGAENQPVYMGNERVALAPRSHRPSSAHLFLASAASLCFCFCLSLSLSQAQATSSAAFLPTGGLLIR
jgi:hypothetical protein